MARVLTALSLLLMAVLLGSGPATAHTEFSGSDPADGSTLRKPPSAVMLTFSEAPIATGLAVIANGPQGRTPLDASVAGNQVVAPWPAQLGAGEYRVAYRVVADDGHPIEGAVSFTVAGGPGASSSPPAPSPTTRAAPMTEDESAGAIPLWLWLVAGALVIGAALVLLRRRNSE
jgi:methionine-rich copper-binding protein CopC